MAQGMQFEFTTALRAIFLVAMLSCSELSRAEIPEVALAMSPLSGSANFHPNVLLSLSIDNSTSRAAYMNGHETYDRTYEYIGYFNPLKCYAYQGGNRNIANGYFYILHDADALHECKSSFSGNFMNWASASLLDTLRYALTGGDRIVDTVQKTILQRAMLSGGSYADPLYFPRKALKPGGNASAPNRVTPFEVNELRVVSCRNRILFSDAQGNSVNCDTPAFGNDGKLANADKRLGEYLVRIQVCDRHEGPTRADLCQAYGKYYKPVGVLQHYAEEMRFGVMSYLLDSSERRYGGVLRAALNHRGQKKFSLPGLLAEENPAAEWDWNTGVLHASPDQDAAGGRGIGGVIHYLNRFGRTGNYKHFDPIGELYYEGIRYLQGKAPTPEAMDGMQEAMLEGFPVIASNVDPVVTACQKNYLISFGDANTHWDRYLPGNGRTSFNGMQPAYDPVRPVESAVQGKTPMLDVKPWTEKVGKMEADSTGLYNNPFPHPRLTDLHMLDTGADGHGSYYIAGLAYWANTQDIRHDKPVRVRTLVVDFDDGGNGSLDGGSRAFKPRESQLFLAAKYGGFRDANQDGNPFVSYADDGKALSRFSVDEWDAAGSGAPETYVLGGDPLQLIDGIRRLFAMLANDGTDNFSEQARQNVLVSSMASGSTGRALYQAGFNRVQWSGSLKKFSVSVGKDGEAKRSSTPIWDAGLLLTGTGKLPPTPLPGERKIYTSHQPVGKPIQTLGFTWRALNATQRTVFSARPGQLDSEDLGEKRVDYLRGARTFEIGNPAGVFRARRSILGDIVSSAPRNVGAPAQISQDSDFADFYARHGKRKEAVYVGANDGMLHAFDAANGTELFAYVPNALLPMLPALTRPDYVHRPYVDGEIAVAEAKLAGKWATVLAAGMGAGGKGVFALDISDPEKFDQGRGALWEFTDSDDPDMGNIVAAPQIAKLRMTPTGGIGDYEYFVIVPSGLNIHKADDAGKFSSSGRAALFLLSLRKGPDEPWKLGTNYYKIKLPAGDERMQNGLASPVLAGGADGIVRHAYAGDLQGNLWRFDFRSGAPWSSALGTNAKPLFVARDAAGRRQPITIRPKLIYATGNAYMVLFGTGKFHEAQDAAPGGFLTQSFYGVLDKPDMRGAIDGRNALASRILVAAPQNEEFILGESGQESTSPASGPAGWYFDFPESDKSGERVVFNPMIISGTIFLTTLLPSTNPCERDRSRLYVLDALSGLPVEGSAMAYTLEPGITGSPLVLSDTLELIGPLTGARGKAKKRHSVLNPNRSDAANNAKPKPSFGRRHISVPAGRLSWREITNWQELRDEAIKK
jgi:type IV pilus assembly protein PilY1